tara:strand:+ start:9465 stop:9719 length:255 start_codon:yes stop_codon:yes gene_type:complete
MKNIMKKIYEYIFSFTGAIWAGCALGAFFGYVILAGVTAGVQNEETKSLQERTDAAVCYSGNMVPVDTDAGKRCVLPGALVVIK